MGIPTFVGAATAVNSLMANPFSLDHVVQSRDITVAAAGMVVFMGLLTMLTEGVIIGMRFCTKDVFNVHMVSCFSNHFSPQHADLFNVQQMEKSG